MTTPAHTTLDRLVEIALGAAAAEAEAAHLAACERCRRARSWAEELVLAGGRRLDEPPAEAMERAAAIGRDPVARAPRRARLSIARLVTDLFARPAPAGVRGGAGASRRLLYESEGAELDLEIAPAAADAERCRLTGQLLDPGAVDALAILWRAGVVAAHAAGDESGAFVFPRVEPGTYRLEVWLPADARVVRVEDLEVR